MNNSNKKGFPINELLPVWVYLSIITLLTTIIILLIFIASKMHFFDNSLETNSAITNNLAAPIVAFVGIFLTFLAFWQQYQANLLQKNQFLKQSFETHFFKLLDLHKENVREMKIEIKTFVPPSIQFDGGISRLNPSNEYKSGMDCCLQFYKELKHIREILRNTNKRKNTDVKITIFDIYKCFFIGLYNFYEKENHEKNEFIYAKLTMQMENQREGLGIQEGRALELGKYFRLLYHTVKFVADYPSNILSENEKYQYLKTLRSQLSHQEQLLLLLNSISEWGEVWLTEGYITKYRICKNVWEIDLHAFGIQKEIYEIINEKLVKYPNLQVKDGKNKEGKFIFEFEENNAIRTNR